MFKRNFVGCVDVNEGRFLKVSFVEKMWGGGESGILAYRYSLLRRESTYRQITMARGALIFKGDATSPPPRKKSSKSKKWQAPPSDVQPVRTTNETTHIMAAPIIRGQEGLSQSSPQIVPVVGRGKVTISGTVVTGYDTKFNTDLQVGDAILVNNEMRVITMRLSDISLNLSSPFSSNIMTSKPMSYSYICKPRDVTKESELEQRRVAIDKAADIERHQNAFASVITTTNTSSAAISASNPNNTVVYRERTEHGNYRIKQMKLADGNVITNRSEMLDIRSKKTSDKYC